MKQLCLLIFIFGGLQLDAQSLSVNLSSDSILLGNVIQLNFSIEDADGEFEPPQFENMDVVSGPNMSSSIQIINGVRSSKKTISYMLRPKDVGQFFIPPAYLIGEDYNLETQPLELQVYPNPDGIIENPVMENGFIFKSFEWPEMGFGRDLDEIKPKTKSKKKLRRI